MTNPQLLNRSWYHRLERLLILLALITAALPVRVLHAHEISPSISDITIVGDRINFDIKLNIESFVARIDLQSLGNTDDTDVENDYDQFRAMTPEKLKIVFREFWPEMAKRIGINTPDPITLALERVSIPATGDIDLPRQSAITLSATLQADTPGFTVSWPAEYGALIIRQQGVAEPYTGYLDSGGQSELISVGGGGQKTAWQTFFDYIPVGINHIIPKGLDHILFVLGMFFLVVKLRPLVWQISIFTLAHTVTLVMGAMGWISIPAMIVEPLIAASIVYVAVENIFTQSLHRWRTVVIFCFGLLHGLGFASVLTEYGLPANRFIPALLGFNIGVEVGQLTVVAIAFLAFAVWFRNHPKYRQWIAIPASALIGIIGAWWFFERVFLA